MLIYNCGKFKSTDFWLSSNLYDVIRSFRASKWYLEAIVLLEWRKKFFVVYCFSKLSSNLSDYDTFVGTPKQSEEHGVNSKISKFLLKHFDIIDGLYCIKEQHFDIKTSFKEKSLSIFYEEIFIVSEPRWLSCCFLPSLRCSISWCRTCKRHPNNRRFHLLIKQKSYYKHSQHQS